MTPIRLGIIGVAERYETIHRPVLEAQPDHFQMIALYDPQPARALQSANRLNAAAYESLDDLFRNTQLEAVIISGSPITTRFDIAQRAINAGLHVVADRPMAASTAQCDQLIQAARRKTVLLTASHFRRWDNAFVHAKTRIQAGEIGELLIVKLATATPPGDEGVYGAGFDLLDFALQMNESSLVEVAAGPNLGRGNESLDAATALFRFEKPPIVEVTLYAAGNSTFALPRLLAIGTRGSFADTSPVAAPDAQPFYDGVWKAIRQRGAVPVVASGARNVVYLAECLFDSARQGKAVRAETLLKPVE